MRERFEGNLADNIRGVALADIAAAISTLNDLLEYEHSAAVIRNLLGGHKELIKAQASIALAATAAEQEQGN